MATRDMTAAESRWWRRFKKAVNDMPASLEVSVYHGSIDVCEIGARQAAFDRDGHSDQTANLDFFRAKRVYPNGEAL